VPAVPVELAISCNESTPEYQRSDVPFSVSTGRDKLCLDRSTFVKDIQIISAEISEDRHTHVWWLTAKFSDSAKPVVNAVMSKAYMRELALVVGGKILSSGLVIGLPAEPEYSTTVESRDVAQKILSALRPVPAH
jgi:hypothetical protein